MRRRELVAAIASTALGWPLALRAQQKAMPVIGFLSGVSPGPYAAFGAAFRRGLSEGGYVEGKNAAIEYAGPRDIMIGCPRWPPTLSAARSM